MAETSTEVGITGVETFEGISQERRTELRGPDGIKRMTQIIREEPAAYTVSNAMALTALQGQWSAVGATDKGADKRAAELLQGLMDDMSREWSRTLRFVMGGVGIGFADLYVVYKRRLGRTPKRGRPPSQYDDGLVGLRKLAIRRQETITSWKMDKNGDYRAMIQTDPETGKELPAVPIEKLLHFTFGNDRGDWEGLGWLEPAYPLYRMIIELQMIYGIGMQRAHVGLPVIEYQTANPPAPVRAEAERMGKNLTVNQQQFVAYRKDMYTMRLETVANANGGEIREGINQMRWEMMSLALLHSLRLGSTSTGARALADPMLDLFRTSVDAYLTDIAEVLNRHLVPRIMQFNPSITKGLKEYPQFTVSSVTDMPLTVIQYLAQISNFLATSTAEDGNWLRGAIGMELVDPAELDVNQEAQNLPDPHEPDPHDPAADQNANNDATGDNGNDQTDEPQLSQRWVNTLTTRNLNNMVAAAQQYRLAQTGFHRNGKAKQR